MEVSRRVEDPRPPDCICPVFDDIGGYRIADLTCPVRGVNGTDPGDGYWDDDNATP